MSEGGTEERVRKVHMHEYLSKENLQAAAAGIHGMVVNLDSCFSKVTLCSSSQFFPAIFS